jgi:sugar/nucleoside kinase (ribokinase family)
VFTAALVARLLVGDRLRAAIAVAVRCARLRAATSSTFPDLPTPQDFESFATRPGAASAPKKERP